MHLLKKDLCLLEDVLQLNEVQQVPLKGLLVRVDLLQLHLQSLKLGLGAQVMRGGAHGLTEQREGALTSRSIIFWGSGASTLPAGCGSMPALTSSAERNPEWEGGQLGTSVLCTCRHTHSLSRLSISSHLRTSLMNFLWKALTSGFSCEEEKPLCHTGLHIHVANLHL